MKLNQIVKISFPYQRVLLIDFISGKILFNGTMEKVNVGLKHYRIPNYDIVNYNTAIHIIKEDDIESNISEIVLNVKLREK